MMRRALALLPVLALACAEAAPPTEDFGVVLGTDARLAIAVDDTALVAYVCGGPTTLGALTVWFVGAASATHLENGAASLELTRTATGTSGTLRTMAGDVLRFSAERAPEGAEAGLYHTLDRGCRTGLVLDPVRGAQGVWCDGEGHAAQVDPGSPAFDADRRLVQVMRPDGRAELELVRISPGELYRP